jgi:hypothetical protein
LGFVDHGSKLQPSGGVVQPSGKKASKGLKLSGNTIGAKVNPWVGPLPAPRISRKLTMEDVITRAKVIAVGKHHKPSLVSFRSALSHREAIFQHSPEMELIVNAGSDKSGAVTGFQNSNFKQVLGRDQA